MKVYEGWNCKEGIIGGDKWCWEVKLDEDWDVIVGYVWDFEFK